MKQVIEHVKRNIWSIDYRSPISAIPVYSGNPLQLDSGNLLSTNPPLLLRLTNLW